MPLAQKPRRTVAPAEPLLTLQEVKTHLRIDHEEEDAYLEGLIQAAAEHLDGRAGILGRALVSQTWVQEWDGFPACRRLRLPLPDIQSVAITYLDASGMGQTLSEDDYHVTHDARSGLVVLDDAASWPSTADRPDAVTATMVAGFGAADDVPRPIRTAALIALAHWYKTREAVNIGNIVNEMPLSVDALAAPYRMVGL
jgi:uncharacterized phiE125 gp8 family phage protein